MKIILSPSKTISKDLKNFNRKDNFSKETEEILKKVPEVRLGDTFHEAFFMYDGLCFRSMEREYFTENELEYIRNHLYIISALYGAVKPFDLISPYRLDFLIKTDMGSLYRFWEDKIAKSVIENEDFIVNIASEEFSKTIKKYCKIPFIDCEFFEMVDGKLKKHSTISKKGRGKMLKFLAFEKVTKIEEIKKFNLDNYKFDEGLSTENKFVFVKEIV